MGVKGVGLKGCGGVGLKGWWWWWRGGIGEELRVCRP